MAIVAPGGFFQNLSNHSAQLMRLASTTTPYKPRTTGSNLTSSLQAAGGVVLQSKSLGVNQQTSANMTVLVHRGKAIIEGTDNILQGDYCFINDADVTLTIATSDPTRLRVDIVYANVRDAAYAGANNDMRLLVATGNPATGTADESVLPTNSIVLAYVNVRANTTQILDSDITDRRRWLTALGGVKPIRSFEVGDPGSLNGDLRYYNGVLQGWDGPSSTWMGLNSAAVVTTKTNWFGGSQYGPSGTTPATLTTLALADPGWPYYIDAQFTLSYAVDSGSRWDFFCRDGGTAGAEICAIAGALSVTNFTGTTSYRSWYGPITGTKTLYITGERISASGNLQVDFPTRACFLNVRQVAAFPSS